jgi:hypothetical protein
LYSWSLRKDLERIRTALSEKYIALEDKHEKMVRDATAMGIEGPL